MKHSITTADGRDEYKRSVRFVPLNPIRCDLYYKRIVDVMMKRFAPEAPAGGGAAASGGGAAAGEGSGRNVRARLEDYDKGKGDGTGKDPVTLD